MAAIDRNFVALAKWGWTLPLALFAIFALRDPAVPGVYMDAVNPDYLAAWLLRGDLVMPAWIYPDNYLAGEFKYPLLNSLYGGNIPVYLGLMFFRVTGFGLEQLRLFHALLGGILLISAYWGLAQWRLPSWATLLTVTLLALDPNFAFAWRTQFYLQLLPAIFLFVAIGLLGRDYDRRERGVATGTAMLWIAGVCLGLAAYCYFIYAFHAAAVVVIYTITQRHRASLRRIGVPLFLGTVLGWLPFVYAHVSIVLNRDFSGYVEMLRALQSTYGVIDSDQGSLGARLQAVWVRFARLFGGRGTEAQILGKSATPALLIWLHAGLLISGPILALAGSLARRRRAAYSMEPVTQTANGAVASMPSAVALTRLTVGLALAHLALVFAVGKPLALQHYIPFVPVLYAVLAAGLATVSGLIQPAAQGSLRPAVFHRAALAFAAVAMLLNVALSSLFMRNLSTHGGAGLYTDAINVAVQELKRRDGGHVLLFPQWGYWMGAIALAGPRFHVFTSSSLQQMEEQLSRDPLLRRSQSFTLVVGRETVRGDEDQVRAAMAQFARASGLRIGAITRCAGRNGGEPLWLVEARRI